jgi:peptidoglycan biosynthesis protein MviN/MurJ (putative lipid II flippase)
MYISIVTAIVGISLGYPLSRTMGVAGLALSFSIGSFVNVIILFYYLRKIYPDIWSKSLLLSYIKITAISVIMGFGMWGAMHLAASHVNMNRFFGVLAQTLVTCAVGFIIYFGLSYFLNSRELRWALTRKINGNKENQN